MSRKHNPPCAKTLVGSAQEGPSPDLPGEAHETLPTCEAITPAPDSAPVQEAPPTQPSYPWLNVSGISIVGPDNRVRADLGLMSDGSTRLTFRDADGNPRMILKMSDQEGASFQLCATNRKILFNCGAPWGRRLFAWVADENGKELWNSYSIPALLKSLREGTKTACSRVFGKREKAQGVTP